MQEWIIPEAGCGTRLDAWLARHSEGASRRRVADWIRRGKVYLDGQPIGPAHAGQRLGTGQRVGLWLDRPGSASPTAQQLQTLRAQVRLVHQDGTLLVVDKPPGLLVDPLPDGTEPEVTLLKALTEYGSHPGPGRLYVVHRIDRETSGLVLFARTQSGCAHLKAQFEAHTPERVYQAVVLGQVLLPEGVWQDRLSWDASRFRQRRAHGRDARAKEALARYAVREQFAEAALIEVSLVTGKRNQIRVQAGLRGHPLLGERQYRFGVPPEPPALPGIGRYALHAGRLAFVHPATNEHVCYTAPLPDDMETLLQQLRARPGGPP